MSETTLRVEQEVVRWQAKRHRHQPSEMLESYVLDPVAV